MLRRTWMAALVVVALACCVQDSHAAHHCRRSSTANCLFGGYGCGLFGNGGGYCYAGYCPPPVYTECGCRIR